MDDIGYWQSSAGNLLDQTTSISGPILEDKDEIDFLKFSDSPKESDHDIQSVAIQTVATIEVRDKSEAAEFYKNWFFSETEYTTLFKAHRACQTDENNIPGIKTLKSDFHTLSDRIQDAKLEMIETLDEDTIVIVETLKENLAQRIEMLLKAYKKDINRVRRSFRAKLANAIAQIAFNAEKRRSQKVTELDESNKARITEIDTSVFEAKREYRHYADECAKLRQYVAKLQMLMKKAGLNPDQETSVTYQTVDDHRVKQSELLSYYQNALQSRDDKLRQLKEQLKKQEAAFRQHDPDGLLMAKLFGKKQRRGSESFNTIGRRVSSTAPTVRRGSRMNSDRRSSTREGPKDKSRRSSYLENSKRDSLMAKSEADVLQGDPLLLSAQNVAEFVPLKRSEEVRLEFEERLAELKEKHNEEKQRQIDQLKAMEVEYKRHFDGIKSQIKKAGVLKNLGQPSISILSNSKAMFTIQTNPNLVTISIQCNLDDKGEKADKDKKD